MKSRLLSVLCGCVLLAAAPQAHAAPTMPLYLAQTGNCATAPEWSVVSSSEDSQTCAYPRVLANGAGVDDVNESFASDRLNPFTLDTSRKLTGTLAITAPALVSTPPTQQADDTAGMADAEFTIAIGGKVVGTVRVAGNVTPTHPVVQPFALPLPASLRAATTNRVTVDVAWTTCVSSIGCAVKVSGATTHSRLSLPTR